MAIFVDDKTKVVYQGLTGSQGRFYGLLNRDYGTQVVAGTNPKKAGTDVDGIPVYATVADAVEATGATASCIFIPAPGVKDAVIEAAEGGVELIVAITEGVPAHDEAWFFNKLKRDFPGVQLLGPNCPGIISPGKANIGITAGHIAKAPVEGKPNVGIVSRSGTLTYQALYELKLNDIGVTTCVGIGGDPVPGTSFIDCLEAFEADPDTKAVMMIGEIGGSAEEEAAAFIADKMTKPVVSYIAGVTAPPGKKMGHAGAIVSGGKGTAAAKQDALEAAGALSRSEPHRGRHPHGRGRQGPLTLHRRATRPGRASHGIVTGVATRLRVLLDRRWSLIAGAALAIGAADLAGLRRRRGSDDHGATTTTTVATTTTTPPSTTTTVPLPRWPPSRPEPPRAVVTPTGVVLAVLRDNADGTYVVRAPCGDEVTVRGHADRAEPTSCSTRATGARSPAPSVPAARSRRT